MRHMAMEEKVSRQPLAQTRTTFCLKVQGFGRPNGFHVNPVGFRANNRIFHRPGLTGVPHGHLRGPRTALPTNRATMWMMGVEHFRATMDHPEFGRVTQITSWYGRSRITKGIGTIGHRLIFKSKIFMLYMHIVNAKRLTAIVECPGSWTIGIG